MMSRTCPDPSTPSADAVDFHKNVRALADERCTADRAKNLAVFNPVAFKNSEIEFTGERVHGAAAIFAANKPSPMVASMASSSVIAFGKESVGHAGSGCICIILSPPLPVTGWFIRREPSMSTR